MGEFSTCVAVKTGFIPFILSTWRSTILPDMEVDRCKDIFSILWLHTQVFTYLTCAYLCSHTAWLTVLRCLMNHFIYWASVCLTSGTPPQFSLIATSEKQGAFSASSFEGKILFWNWGWLYNASAPAPESGFFRSKVLFSAYPCP